MLTLLGFSLLNCKDPPTASDERGLPHLSGKEVAANPSPFPTKRMEIDATVEAMQSPADFELEYARFKAGDGVWNMPKEDRVPLIRYLFGPWFKMAPKEALAAISTIPNSDGGRARNEALRAGLQASADMPEAYIEAATTLLPDYEAGGIICSVYSRMFRKNPDTWFEFVQTKLGQGRTKQIAITTFFRLQVNTNFRQAVEYALKLTFEEDRRDAFVTIGSPGTLPSQEDLDWALSVGMPKTEVKNIRERMPR